MGGAVPSLPPLPDLIGIAVFALSGALVAVRMRMTFVTVCFFALVTGVGGGTVRDVLIGIRPFWLQNQWVPGVILGVSVMTWFTPHQWWENRLLEWADAVGLGAYSVLGTAKALAFGVAPLPAAILGVITGCAGGIIRDLLADQPSILIRPELYVTAAALGATLCTLGSMLDVPREMVWAVSALAAFALRGAALVFQIELPPYSRQR
jgi:uncharacterized membrane protein YeiH